MLIIKNFDQLIKISFDQTPKLLENFDQLKMSSEIRSSDHFPFGEYTHQETYRDSETPPPPPVFSSMMVD
jgi:hypothetical protein